MKAKHALILLVFGFCLDAIGALMKIMHRPQWDTLFTLAMVLKILGGLLFAYKLVTYPKWKDFMNR